MSAEELASKLEEMGFQAKAMVTMVIVSLDCKLYASEIEQALEQAEMPNFLVLQAVNAVVVVVDEVMA